MATEAEDSIGVKIGDKVQVETSDSNFLKTAAIIYLVPIAGLIIGSLIGSNFNPKIAGIMGVLGGISGFFLAFFSIHYYDKLKHKKNITPQIVKILKES